MRNTGVAGVGYVGLLTAAWLAECGHMEVTSWYVYSAPSGSAPVIRVLAETNSESRMKQLMAQSTGLVEEAIIRSRDRT